jgi:hypothetical protein
MSNCNRSSNNRFFNSPSRMADGRLFTDYRPNIEMNRYIESGNKIKNTQDYRVFLSRNGEKIIEKNKEYIFLKNGQNNCMKPYHIGTMLPEQSRVVCDQHTCKVVTVDENGIGQGREYVTDATNPLLSPLMKPDMKLDNNACVSPFDSFNYYPIIDNYEVKTRSAVPFGGDILKGGDPSVYN